MKFEPIITSLLDTDFYKLNMHQLIFHKFKEYEGEYHFKCRNEDVTFTHEMFEEIKAQIEHLGTLSFKDDELAYLSSLPGFKNDYISFLYGFRLNPDYVHCALTKQGELICIVRGPCYLTMPFEIYLLEIINEVYFKVKYHESYDELEKSAQDKLDEKIQKMQKGIYTFKFAEFGCRRRLSQTWQDKMVKAFVTKTNNCIGTSNVLLAKKYKITPIGTFAHELVQMYQVITSPLTSNRDALYDWYEEYHGLNGIALTDTLTTDLFLKNFNLDLANKYKGVRHDSGDPYEWGEKIISHYLKLGIDPLSKTLLFSDSLDFDKAQELYDYFKSRINVSFGIGTFCSNDTNKKPLNIVIKLQKINELPVAKLSDNIGKTMCLDKNYLHYLIALVKENI